MEHNIIDTTQDNSIKDQVLFHQENNIDGKDNLNNLPESAAVYAICGRVNGKPANARYVGITNNLQDTLKQLFDKEVPAPEGNDCFKTFMLSIKIKTILYLSTDGLTEDEQIEQKKIWNNKYKPECTEALNEIH